MPTLRGLTLTQASRATASSVWLALLLGAALQAAVWAKAPDIVSCEPRGPGVGALPLLPPAAPRCCSGCPAAGAPQIGGCPAALSRPPTHPPNTRPLPPHPDMSGADVAVGGYAVQYLRARSWGLPAALTMMSCIGAAR